VEETIPHLEDFQLVQLAIDGDRYALQRLGAFFQNPLVKFLMHRGASAQEAEEIAGEMWADCLTVGPTGSPRIASYDGNCQLSSWLNTVAVNRLISLKRKHARLNRLGFESINKPVNDDGGAATLESTIPGEARADSELPLIELLKEAIEAGFAACTPEQFVLIRLACADRLRFADLGRMWGCNPGTISRRLEEAKCLVERTALQHVHHADPWIELEWEDFAQLCRSTSLGALGFD
jgi:RNA polymerase sigma factor (sigma-70 family)